MASRKLAKYRAKRDFAKTTEPSGDAAKASSGHSYLIQKHAARRLHYDFRLELDGTLKSWAVTKGPSLNPADKRLAVHVEDHPLAYGNFEGTIPKGEYGGGTVMLWDQGSWTPIGDAERGYKKGKPGDHAPNSVQNVSRKHNNEQQFPGSYPLAVPIRNRQWIRIWQHACE
jgi:bifunctional non-homologous end joining protein LigD